jgi:hypothetical protein
MGMIPIADLFIFFHSLYKYIFIETSFNLHPSNPLFFPRSDALLEFHIFNCKDTVARLGFHFWEGGGVF